MNAHDNNPTEAESLRIFRALRFALVAVVLGVSYGNIHTAFSLTEYQQIYHDMFSKPLPTDTDFVFRFRILLDTLSLALPTIAVITLFASSLSRSIYIVGCIIGMVFIQLFFTWQAVSTPLFQIGLNIQGNQ
jgi:hypothetical protein